MSRLGRAGGAVLVFGLALALAGCGRSTPPRSLEDLEFAANILTDATYVRTRFGNYVEGYLARCEINYTPRRIFIALDLPKYEKGERLRVEGVFAEDSVRLSYGEQVNWDYALFIVRNAKIDVGDKGPAPPLDLLIPKR